MAIFAACIFCEQLYALLKQFMLNPSNAEATSIQSTSMQKIFENHLNPVMLVFIG